ncbi:YetF domain-containing protein [Paenibacillus sp. FJAT-26967]|uniref:YetF domain-containing protein n=1 Tax=Paenibacillus sp. FJAT-26967 TaxID=1729690 RepID=UPI0008388B71|nr:YetF domain-containing protein [Paenibacillus sp. FJAT-26967]
MSEPPDLRTTALSVPDKAAPKYPFPLISYGHVFPLNLYTAGITKAELWMLLDQTGVNSLSEVIQAELTQPGCLVVVSRHNNRRANRDQQP